MTNRLMAALATTLLVTGACNQGTSAAVVQDNADMAQATSTTGQSNFAQAISTTRVPDVVYVPTPQPVVDAMLRLAKVKKGDVLYDLGSGDGRIPVTAAREYGVKAVGIDIDPERIAEAKANVERARVGNLVTVQQGDLFEADLRPASVVTLYLLDSLNEKLRPKLLRELKPGTRIVSHAFSMGDWKPEATQDINGNKIFLWTVPPRESAAD